MVALRRSTSNSNLIGRCFDEYAGGGGGGVDDEGGDSSGDGVVRVVSSCRDLDQRLLGRCLLSTTIN